MTMQYGVGKQEDLAKISAGDQIHADLVVNGADMYLENISVAGH
jgi:hypothetical protein